MNREEATELILEAKKEQGLTWKTLAQKKVGMSDVWTTAALMGQVHMNEEEAGKVRTLLGLGPGGGRSPCRITRCGAAWTRGADRPSSTASTRSCRSTASR